MPLRGFFALDEFIKINSEKACDNLEENVLAAILALAKIGGDRFFRLQLVRYRALRVQLEDERVGEAFLFRIAPGKPAGIGLALDNDGKDLLLPPKAFEYPDLFVDVPACRRARRAEDDQGLGLLEGLADFAGKVVTGREICPVPEYASDEGGFSRRGSKLRAKGLGDAVAFKFAVQPGSDRLVRMAVTEKSGIFPSGRRRRPDGCLIAFVSCAYGVCHWRGVPNYAVGSGPRETGRRGSGPLLFVQLVVPSVGLR